MVTGKDAYIFLSTPSVWRATGHADGVSKRHLISIHALRVEGDEWELNVSTGEKEFLSTPSVWRATGVQCNWLLRWIFLSTPSVWRATVPGGFGLLAHGISIHVLRVEGDVMDVYMSSNADISIHALRVEGDRQTRFPVAVSSIFLSTPSVWRATRLFREALNTENHFYPRPPCGGRPPGANALVNFVLFLSTPSVWRATCGKDYDSADYMISIHALRVEGDTCLDCGSPVDLISIHALRVEGDIHFCAAWYNDYNFYPRPPCGGRRLQGVGMGYYYSNFYPRPPCGGRQALQSWFYLTFQISIHALRVEGDRWDEYNNSVETLFLSTPSVWRATTSPCTACSLKMISIHALRVEGDFALAFTPSFSNYFYPRPPCGGRLLQPI